MIAGLLIVRDNVVWFDGFVCGLIRFWVCWVCCSVLWITCDRLVGYCCCFCGLRLLWFDLFATLVWGLFDCTFVWCRGC